MEQAIFYSESTNADHIPLLDPAGGLADGMSPSDYYQPLSIPPSVLSHIAISTPLESPRCHLSTVMNGFADEIILKGSTNSAMSA